MVDFVSIAVGISTILSSLVGVIFYLVIIYFIAIFLGIVRDYRAMFRDRIGFERGKIKKAAIKKGIDIVYEAKQTQRSEIDEILDEPEKPKKDTKKA